MKIAFDDLPLEKAQKDLLADLVEADARIEPPKLRQFMVIGVGTGHILVHPEMERDRVDPGDVRTLEEYALVRSIPTSGTTPNYEVTPIGRQYYAWMKQQQGEPVERVEAEIRRLLDARSFRERHATAYDRWAAAEADLWGAETEAQFTDIGHACREAIQQFVTDLVEKHQTTNVNRDPQKTVDRLRAVMEKLKLSNSVEEFAAALLAYFGRVSDLIQRQEHGAQKGGSPLKWEDARRVVFQSAMVMFELDRTLG